MKQHHITVTKPDGSVEKQTRPSWYRRPSLAFTRPDAQAFHKHQRTEYIEWLCRSKGWFAGEKTCPECYGQKTVNPNQDHMTYSQMRAWKKKRAAAGKPPHLTGDDRIDCPSCDGTGKVANDGECLDLTRAGRYVETQRELLEEKAQVAVNRIEALLYKLGYRNVITRTCLAETVEEYDTMTADYDAANREFEAAREAARAAEQAFNTAFSTMSAEEQCAWLNRDDGREVPYKALDRKAEELRQSLWQYGNKCRGFWYRPGTSRIIWVGVKNQPRYYGSPDSDTQIIIAPGRSPSGYELDLLVESMIASEQQLELKAAA